MAEARPAADQETRQGSEQEKDPCDEEPCLSAAQALGRAKGEYNARLQDLRQAASALGLTATIGVGALVGLVVAKLATKAIPILGWVLAIVDAALLIALGIAYVRFRLARTALEEAKEQVRQDCPRKCWPDNVLKEH